MCSQQASYEAAMLGAYYRQMDDAERLAVAVEAEMECLSNQVLGDLIHRLPVPWRARLEDLAYEIAEALVEERKRRSLEDLAARKWEDAQ